MKIIITTNEGTTIIDAKGEMTLHFSPYHTDCDNNTISNEMGVGSVICFANHDWTVVHRSDRKCYLMLHKLCGLCTFSELPQKCKEFESMFSAAELACLEEVTVEGITGKVFVASKAQLDGGFEWFKNGDVSYRRGVDDTYWTSTPNGSHFAWDVGSNGTLGGVSSGVTLTYGFRPCICLDIEAYRRYVDVHNK